MARGDTRIDASDALRGIKKLRSLMIDVADVGAKRAADALLRDSIPFIPVRTGELRDSGEVTSDGQLLYVVGWTAESEGGFHYSERQYREAFTHVNGFFAAEWVDKAQEANPEKYVGIVAETIDLFLARGG